MQPEREDEAFQRRAEDDEGTGIMTGEKDEYPGVFQTDSADFSV